MLFDDRRCGVPLRGEQAGAAVEVGRAVVGRLRVAGEADPQAGALAVGVGEVGAVGDEVDLVRLVGVPPDVESLDGDVRILC